MKDKDKLILVLEIGLKDIPGSELVHKFNNTYAWFCSKVDDSVLILPTTSFSYKGVKINELNTKNWTKEQVENIIVKAKKLIEEYKNEN